MFIYSPNNIPLYIYVYTCIYEYPFKYVYTMAVVYASPLESSRHLRVPRGRSAPGRFFTTRTNHVEPDIQTAG